VHIWYFYKRYITIIEFDKIDLLHRQNKTLEQMAETLFRQWFVEEAGEDWEDWEEVPLSYFGKIICGKTPSKKKRTSFLFTPGTALLSLNISQSIC
jgi:restriction endonuclease S subunit